MKLHAAMLRKIMWLIRGSKTSHQATTFEAYAGWRTKPYGPLLTIPLLVRLEHLAPNAMVAAT